MMYVDAMLHDRSQGSAGGFRLTLKDITARREAEAQLAASLEELRHLQEDLLRQERFAVLGQFASSVAHELNRADRCWRNDRRIATKKAIAACQSAIAAAVMVPIIASTATH